MKIYSNGPDNMNTAEALIAADVCGLNVELEFVDKTAVNSEPHKTKNPRGLFPLLEL
jgi:hypothetical protein